jgi:16S rRNA (guanine1207-N2)-methyltransferase
LTSRTPYPSSGSSSTPYHQYQTLEAEIGARTYGYVSKPGIDHWYELDDDLELLLDGSDLAAHHKIVCVGCGSGLIGAVITDRLPEAQLTLLDSSVVAARAAEQTMALHNRPRVRVILSDGLGAVRGEQFDRVLIDLPKGKALVQQILAEAFDVLGPGGMACLAGGNREGIKSYAALLGQVFGDVSVARIGGGHRVVCAVKQATDPPTSASAGAGADLVLSEVMVRGRAYQVASKAGVFSWQRLDDGTRLLLESMEVGEADRVLDLGCGCGIVGVVAATLAPSGHIHLVDSQIAAIHAAQRTVEANQLSNATVLLSDVAWDVRDLTFDVVATNLPFHLGVGSERVTALQFIDDAHDVLRSGGFLYLVSNLFLKYEPHVVQAFGNCETVCKNTRYKVLRARKLPMRKPTQRRHQQTGYDID